jgi:hypothetical protein
MLPCNRKNEWGGGGRGEDNYTMGFISLLGLAFDVFNPLAMVRLKITKIYNIKRICFYF